MTLLTAIASIPCKKCNSLQRRLATVDFIPSTDSPGFAPIALSAQDYKFMLALATGGKVVSRETVGRALGGNFPDYDQRRPDTQMRRLRRKVEEACGLQLPVTTLRGIGYHFYDEIEVCQ